MPQTENAQERIEQLAHLLRLNKKTGVTAREAKDELGATQTLTRYALDILCKTGRARRVKAKTGKPARIEYRYYYVARIPKGWGFVGNTQ